MEGISRSLAKGRLIKTDLVYNVLPGRTPRMDTCTLQRLCQSAHKYHRSEGGSRLRRAIGRKFIENSPMRNHWVTCR